MDQSRASDVSVRTPSAAPATELIEMVRGYQLSQALYVAAALGVADHLGEGPRSCAELAVATGAHPDALRRLMVALASRGVFEQVSQWRFGLTELSRLLASGEPGSVRGQMLLWGDPMQWRPWGELLTSVRTGAPAFEAVFGVDHWGYLAREPEARRMFEASQAAHPSHSQVPEAYDFSGADLIVDVGGGVGRLLSGILRGNPSTRGALLDRPNVAADARAALEAAGLADRCEVIGGDFFDDMPSGADLYILSNVLMDWDDADAVRLLRRCREAMGADGRQLVVERIIPADNAPSLAQLGDLMGLVVTGGRMRSASAFDRLFEASGLRRTGTVMTPSGYAVMEARPVERASASA